MKPVNWLTRALLNSLRQLAETPPNVEAAIRTIRYVLGNWFTPEDIDRQVASPDVQPSDDTT